MKSLSSSGALRQIKNDSVVGIDTYSFVTNYQFFERQSIFGQPSAYEHARVAYVQVISPGCNDTVIWRIILREPDKEKSCDPLSHVAQEVELLILAIVDDRLDLLYFKSCI